MSRLYKNVLNNNEAIQYFSCLSLQLKLFPMSLPWTYVKNPQTWKKFSTYQFMLVKRQMVVLQPINVLYPSHLQHCPAICHIISTSSKIQKKLYWHLRIFNFKNCFLWIFSATSTYNTKIKEILQYRFNDQKLLDAAVTKQQQSCGQLWGD